MRIIWAVLFLYAVGFVCFFPNALTNFDEVSYVRQAAALAAGTTTVETIDPFTGLHSKVLPSDYPPPGTPALMAPFVWAAGWQGAFVLGLLALVVCVLATAKWITDAGGSPLFALIILGFGPALVIARVGMSDVPSAALVAVGLWLFWPSHIDRPWTRLLAGFIAGVSVCLRESNPILFAIFFAGAVFRRERNILALVIGGLAGVASRFLVAMLVYGNPVLVKTQEAIQHYGFTGMHAGQNLLMYSTAVLVLVPGGLAFVFGYRGHRWPELISTVAIFVGLFIIYNYDASSSGGLKQWILSLRFMIPLVPIVAFAMSHTLPKWYIALTRSSTHGMFWKRVARVIVPIWLASLPVMGFLVNWRGDLWCSIHRDVVRTLYGHTNSSQPILTDIPATVKFLNELYGSRTVTDLSAMNSRQIQTLVDRHKVVQIVFFGRDDSVYWLRKSRQNRAWIDSLPKQLVSTLAIEQRFPSLGVLQIWNVQNRSWNR